MQQIPGMWVIGRELTARERVRGLLGIAGFEAAACGTGGAELLALRVSRPELVLVSGEGMGLDDLRRCLAPLRRGGGEGRTPAALVSSREALESLLPLLRRGLADDVFTLPMAPEALRERILLLLARAEGARGVRENLYSTYAVIGELSGMLRAREAAAQCGEHAGHAAYMGFIHALVRALESKDRYTAFHSARVAKLALRTSRALGFTPHMLKVMRRASLLHDIGKIGIEGEVINKRGTLSRREWRKLQLHPDLGSLILKPLPGLKEEAVLVRRHHERWDGQGYPARLEREEAGLPAGVLAVCDAFDAMTSERSYRERMSPAVALAEIRRGRERQFHPEAVDAFVKLF